jgi:hypothetical protein
VSDPAYDDGRANAAHAIAQRVLEEDADHTGS